ncbi:cyclase family protein [Sabulilitoribacter multivorans]|uniref:Cyclase family protein n=1 Tax=Flaviramulus multivorans TaxID=1304750 RepID=A0ABS9IIL4_9FLAO|nr:cyclase family protein [Flaviramulus multivorans]MCF7560403.1 cyclase family protein [Flaviramulus multivorans]
MKTNIIYFFIISAFIACKQTTQDTSESGEQSKNVIEYSEIIDLSYEFSEETIYWVTAKQFKLDTVFNGQTDKGFYYSAYNFTTAEHGGTHIDAPIHFSKNSETVDQIPLKNLVAPAIKIDVSTKALNNPDYQITVEDLTQWEAKEDMQIPNGSIVLLHTGFSSFYPDVVKYLGTNQRGEEAVKLLHFPGLSPEAAQWLVTNRNINAIGIDTASIDYGQSQHFGSHVNLMSKNISAFENLTNLDKLPNKGFYIVALPMKIKGGSGAPLRIVALLK